MVLCNNNSLVYDPGNNNIFTVTWSQLYKKIWYISHLSLLFKHKQNFGGTINLQIIVDDTFDDHCVQDILLCQKKKQKNL